MCKRMPTFTEVIKTLSACIVQFPCTHIMPPCLNNYKHSLTLGSQRNTIMLCNCSCVLTGSLLIKNGVHSNYMAFSVLYKGHQLIPLTFFFLFNKRMSPLVINCKNAFIWCRFTGIRESLRKSITESLRKLWRCLVQYPNLAGLSPKIEQVV